MSETEHKQGKLKATGKTLDQFLGGVKIPDFYPSKKEYFDDEFYRKAYLISGIVHEVLEEEYEDRDIYQASKNESGDIDFQIKFYNGGCSHREAIEKALNSINLELD